MKARKTFQTAHVGLLLGLLIVGCAVQPEVVTPTQSISATAPPASPTITLTASPSLTPSQTLSPTPTPIPILSAALPSVFTSTLPNGAIARLGKGYFTSTNLSPDGKLLAVGTSTGLTMYDALSLQELWSDTTVRAIYMLSWSPDNTMISGVYDNSPVGIIWDALSGERLSTLAGHSSNIYMQRWSPAEDLLVSSDLDGRIILWDGETGTRLRTLVFTDPEHTSLSYRGWFSFSPDGQQIAAEYYHHSELEENRKSYVFVWDVQTGQQLHLFKQESSELITWSRDSKLLAIGGEIWDVLTGQMVHDFGNARTEDGCPLETWAYGNWSPESELLAVLAPGNGAIRICNGESELLYTFDKVNAFGGWSPNGQQLIIRTDPDNRLVIYSANGEPLHEIGVKENCGWGWGGCGVNSSPDWTRFYYRAGDHAETLEAWKINGEPSKMMIVTDSSHLLQLAWSSDGKRLVTIPDEFNRLTIWDIESLEPLQVFQGQKYAWTPDLLTVVGGGEQYFIIQDTLTGEMVKTSTGGPVHSLSWTPNGDYLVAGGDWGFYLRDPRDGGLIQYFEQGVITNMIWSPDGSHLAVFDSDNNIAIWDVLKEEAVFIHKIKRKLSNAGDFVYDENFTWSPSGNLMAFAEPGNSLLIYATDPLQLIQDVELESEIVDFSFSPDGGQLATVTDQEEGLSTLRTWSVSNGNLLWEWQNPEFPITRRDSLTSITWSADGRYIAVGRGLPPTYRTIEGMYTITTDAEPGQIYLLDAETGHLLGTFEGHTGGVEDVAFSPDGSVLASASLDGTVLLWDMSQR